jgi:hypothetical protein
LVKANHTIRSDVKQLYRFHTVPSPFPTSSKARSAWLRRGARNGVGRGSSRRICARRRRCL